jgi:hypothetical protein
MNILDFNMYLLLWLIVMLNPHPIQHNIIQIHNNVLNNVMKIMT